MTVGRTASSSPILYYKIAVQNVGGLSAVGFNLTDSSTTLPFGTATCPAKPASIAAGGLYVCIYPKTLTSDQVLVNTATATATNVAPDSADSDSATVTVATCANPSRLVPSLIGLDKTTGLAAWGPSGAGFNGTYTNISNGTIATQSVQAWSCQPKATAITVTNGTP
jgi:hypothetical protein